MTPNRTFNSRGFKPTEPAHLRIGGWAQIYIGDLGEHCEGLDEQRFVFGHIVDIDGQKIRFQIADEVFSPEKTGYTDGQRLSLELDDFCSSEYSPAAQDHEAQWVVYEQERDLLAQHEGEFERRWPECALDKFPSLDGSADRAAEYEQHVRRWAQARREFVDELIAREIVQ